MIKFWQIIFLIFTFPYLVFAQTSITIEDYLQASSNTPNLEIYTTKLNFLENNPYEIPKVEELEFRTETSRFDWKRQEFLVRSSFSTKKERNQQNQLFETQKAILQNEQQLTLHAELENRYSTVLEYYFAGQELNWCQKQKIILNDKLSILQKMAQLSTNFNLNEYIKTEETLHNLDQKILQLQQKEIRILQQIQFALERPEIIQLDTNQIISIENLITKIETLPDSCQQHPYINERMARIEQHMAEFKLEEAENGRILDFVQLRYGGRDNLELYQEFSVGVGFNIPLKKTIQANLNEIKLDKLDDREKLKNFEYYCQQEIQFAKQEAQLLWQQYQLLLQQNADSQARYSSLEYETLGTQNPLALLEIEENLLRRSLATLEIKENIYEIYVDLLQLTGLMSQLPLVNYLRE